MLAIWKAFSGHCIALNHFTGVLSTTTLPRLSHRYLNELHIWLHRRSNMSESKTHLVSVCQMTSTMKKEDNFQTCQMLIHQSVQRGAEMVFLPECFDFVGESKQQTVEQAEPLSGPLMSRFQDLACQSSVWLSLGGFHEKDKALPKVHNAHVIIDNKGTIIAVYRKAHLFDVDIPDGPRLKESDFVIAGKALVSPVPTPVGRIGLGICYDLRFPEFSLSLTHGGAEILTFPSAFTQTTGMAHWEALLRSRAIENQCFVIAAAQTGSHNSKRVSYGYSMIVDPWGCVTACCSEGTGIATAEIDLTYLKKIRRNMPVSSHRRTDLYGPLVHPILGTSGINSQPTYQFGQVLLQSSQLFYKTPLSMAFVNRSPVRPGHVLVAPLRPALRMQDLNSLEISDLFTCVLQVQQAVETEYGTTSSTVAVQDGPEAGRSIDHFHVHILPRRKGDFPQNDDVYVELQKHDKTEDRRQKNQRTEEQMMLEAANLRRYFSEPEMQFS